MMARKAYRKLVEAKQRADAAARKAKKRSAKADQPRIGMIAHGNATALATILLGASSVRARALSQEGEEH